jgi:hypothetical protein
MEIGWTRIFNQISKIQVKSITDPLFKYAIYTLALGLISSIFSKYGWVTLMIFIISGILFVLAIVFYIYFAIRNPDYLRSENFQIRKQSIEMLGDKDNHLNPNTDKIVLIASPYSKKALNNHNEITEQ